MRRGIRIHGDGMIARNTVMGMAIHTAVGDRVRYWGRSSHDEQSRLQKPYGKDRTSSPRFHYKRAMKGKLSGVRNQKGWGKRKRK
jgi:hypothetical protein